MIAPPLYAVLSAYQRRLVPPGAPCRGPAALALIWSISPSQPAPCRVRRGRTSRRGAAVGLRLFRRPNLPPGNVLALLNLAVMCSLFFLLSLYLQLVTEVSPLTAGVTLLPLTVLGAAVGQLAARTGAGALIVGGMALTATGLALLVRIDIG